jgi:hypothetical protein
VTLLRDSEQERIDRPIKRYVRRRYPHETRLIWNWIFMVAVVLFNIFVFLVIPLGFLGLVFWAAWRGFMHFCACGGMKYNVQISVEWPNRPWASFRPANWSAEATLDRATDGGLLWPSATTQRPSQGFAQSQPA